MNLDQFKNWALGQRSVAKYTDGRYPGECVSLINQYLAHCFGIMAGAWGHAYAWANDTNPVRQWFDRVWSVQDGDIIVYPAGWGGSSVGHIGIAFHGQLLNQNSDGRGTVKITPLWDGYVAVLRRKRATNQGEEMIPDRDHLRSLWLVYLQREPSEEEYSRYVGASYNSMIETLDKSPERPHVDDVVRTGKQAINDRWAHQILDIYKPLADQVPALRNTITKLQSQKSVDPKVVDATIQKLNEAEAALEKLKG